MQTGQFAGRNARGGCPDMSFALGKMLFVFSGETKGGGGKRGGGETRCSSPRPEHVVMCGTERALFQKPGDILF